MGDKCTRCFHPIGDYATYGYTLHPAEKCFDNLRSTIAAQAAQIEALKAELNQPTVLQFVDGVVREAAHQRQRWGAEHDAGKEPQDWFWLLGYLSGKALRAAIDGDTEKALHHTISSAAALANWHAALLGTDNRMRPGIDAARASQSTGAEKTAATETKLWSCDLHEQ